MRGLHGWMRLLEGSEAAVLSTLLKELERITGSDESSAMQLAEVILRDPNLTSNIIKIGNSVQFNASTIPVTTVSRAILNIGFKNIRSFCLSLKVLEAVLKNAPSPLLLERLATTLHGAAQAKALCEHLPAWKREEVFVASLLSHLTELLVLGVDEDDVQELKGSLDATSTELEKNKIAERVLGVSFTRLSKTLMKQWRIDGLINDVLAAPDEPNELIRSVQLGDEISRAALFGWDSPEFKLVMEKVAEFKDVKEHEAIKLITSTADEAASSVASLGHSGLKGLIPDSKSKGPRKTNAEPDSKPELKPDPNVQLEVLQSLSSMLMGSFDINSVFKKLLDGLNRGVGLERNALAIFDKSHLKLNAKYVAGEGTERWRESFQLRYEKSHSGFLFNLFQQDQPVWSQYDGHRAITQHINAEYKAISQTNDFFIAPLMAKGKKVGVIYADMGVSKRPLSQSQFEGFCHFVQQARLALTVLASK
ncbi:MAG: HDOD domain-containing protein [Oleiphilaceae bacterium]|nr:HDOD domain-containing protein [Oleiphilaceae bacterium]